MQRALQSAIAINIDECVVGRLEAEQDLCLSGCPDEDLPLPLALLRANLADERANGELAMA